MEIRICPFCRGGNVNKSYDSRLGKDKITYACSDCGRTWQTDANELIEGMASDLVLCVRFVAEARGERAEYTLEVPYKDGEYDIASIDSGATCRFRRLKINGGNIFLDNEPIVLNDDGSAEITKNFIAYGVDRVGWNEVVGVTFNLKF